MQMLLNGQSELAFYRVTHFSDEVTALCDWQKHECDLRGTLRQLSGRRPAFS
jgi:hypothetical protein